jgi:hypothetical protein
LLRKNAVAIQNTITNFDQQHVRGFEPEFCRGAYDQSKSDHSSEGRPDPSGQVSKGP